MYETISSPINYGGLVLKNRIIFAPTTFGLAEDEYFEKIRKIGQYFVLRHFALHFTEQRGMIVFLVHVSTPSYEFVFI